MAGMDVEVITAAAVAVTVDRSNTQTAQEAPFFMPVIPQ
jgi:hypothetical protein